MMNSKTKVAFYVLLVFVVLAFISAIVVVSPGPHPIASTKLMLTICNDELSISPELVKKPDNQADSGWRRDSLFINELLADKLRNSTNQAMWLSFREQHPHILVDAWGEPLIFMMRGEDGIRVFGGVLRQTNSIRVWSAGPNRNNEFGAGDDIAP